MTESTEAPTSRPHGRRARRLTPEEAAELEARAAQEAVDQTGPIPPLRGAVPAPGADAPVPKLRKFGRRARIVELVDSAPDEVEVTGESPAVDADADTAERAVPAPAPAEPPTDVLTAIPDAEPAAPRATESPVVAGAVLTAPRAATEAPATEAPATEAPAADASASPAPAAPAATATAARPAARDADGVELGEMTQEDAPDPRPAPRFDGRVLHRPERTGSHRMLWLVWALIALAVVVLVILLVTGVIGGTDGALGAHDAATAILAAAPDAEPWRGTPA